MATLASSTAHSPPRHSRKSCARRCERCCCSIFTYFPLAFIYGLTTWAVWVQANIGFLPSTNHWTGNTSAFLGIALYVLLNWSYSTAVFTDPGSSSRPFGAGAGLPVQEPRGITPLTAKYNGEMRYCKKCQARKPDRAHHCSTCRRCVLQMDHHCPWLATCVGFHNRKPFLLFLVYTCLFCWLCFAAAVTWIWTEILNAGFQDQLMPVNYVLLAVMAGVIGLVLSGFTGWHIYLAFTGQTTIESLEKTRYLSPLRKSIQHQTERNYINNTPPTLTEQIREIHANAIPGVTRPEEGTERISPAHDSLRSNFADAEYDRERQRYHDYLDEKDSEQLPHAFNLGSRRNLLQLFGERPLLWALPICNSTGDGWRWETSSKWIDARDEIMRKKEARMREQERWDHDRHRAGPRPTGSYTDMHAASFSREPPHRSPSAMAAGSQVTMRTLDPAGISDGYDDSSSSDEDDRISDERQNLVRPGVETHSGVAATPRLHEQTMNWNDLPDDFLDSSEARSGSGTQRVSRASGPRRQG